MTTAAVLPIAIPLPQWAVRRAGIIAAVATYALVFHSTYLTFVGPVYSYLGTGLERNDPALAWVSWCAALVPALWLPSGFRRPSQLFVYIQYFFIYVPLVFVLPYATRPVLLPGDTVEVMAYCLVGMSILQAVPLLPLLRLRRPRLPAHVFWTLFGGSGTILMLYVIVTLGRNFQLADLNAIYDVRAATSELIEGSGSRLGFYAQMWLSGFYLPMLFAVAAFYRRRWLFGIVALGYLILFGVGGSKTTLFSMVYIPLVYAGLTVVRYNVTAAFALGLTVMLGAVVIAQAVLPAAITVWYVAIVHVRTFTLPSVLFLHHLEFFRHNPITYGSHIKGINLLVRYPYSGDLPREIGTYFFGIPVGSNAGFWAGDGIAAFGRPGIVVFSLVAAALFWLLDLLSEGMDGRFVAVAATFIAVTFANVSLATTTLSGGLFLLLLALSVYPRARAQVG